MAEGEGQRRGEREIGVLIVRLGAIELTRSYLSASFSGKKDFHSQKRSILKRNETKKKSKSVSACVFEAGPLIGHW